MTNPPSPPFSDPPPASNPADLLSATRAELGEDYDELARLFLHHLPRRTEAMRTALQGADAIALARLAHTLGGSCLSIGANTLAQLCAALEANSAAGRLDAAGAQVQVIEAEAAHVSRRLLQLILSPPAAAP